ncbi:hypothetical protein [Nocardia sp. NPDC004711]
MRIVHSDTLPTHLLMGIGNGWLIFGGALPAGSVSATSGRWPVLG